MRVPISWLKQYVDTSLSTADIAEVLTVGGVEVEECEQIDGDEVLELAILANIARCQSVIGVAEELAALTGESADVHLELADLQDIPYNLQPKIEEPRVCSRFSLALIDNVSVTDSPAWMRKRLQAVGVTPINNIVDASNYVMFELGQPTHAYDADRLQDMDLAVRLSKQDEALHTLAQDDEQPALKIPKGHPVIVCDNKPVAIAGVVGGTPTSVGLETRKLLLESANFEYIAIRRAQAACKIFTDASARFSRGVDPALTLIAIARFVTLLRETCPALNVVSLGDKATSDFAPLTVKLTAEEVNQSLGLRLNIAQIADFLSRSGIACEMDQATQSLNAVVTSKRNDITLSCDLVEEVARLYGYDNIPETMPLQPVPPHPRNTRYELRERARDDLVRFGLQEVMSYSMLTPEFEAHLYAAEKAPPSFEYVEMMNPLSEDRTVLRRSLLPYLLQHVGLNLRHRKSCHLFEIGRVFLPEETSTSPLLPREVESLAVVMVGPMEEENLYNPKPRAVDFFDAKAGLESLCAQLHIGEISFSADECAPYIPGQCAKVSCGGSTIGYIGVIHPLVLEGFGIEDKVVVGYHCNLEVLLGLAKQNYQVVPPLKYPSIELDVSLVIDEGITASWLEHAARNYGGDTVRDVKIFDLFRSVDKLGAGKKAIAFRLYLNAGDRTLTMDEASVIRETIVEKLGKEVGATLRY